MEATCPACLRAYEPTILIAGARCPACLARDEEVIAGDRFGRPLFRAGPGWVEFDRVPPQPRATVLGGAYVVGVAIALGLTAIPLGMLERPPWTHLGPLALAGIVLGGLVGLATFAKLFPEALGMKLRARDAILELGRASRIQKTIPAGLIARFRARETSSGHGLAAQLRNGRELLLASDLTDPDDAMRLANALREVLGVSAKEVLQVGSRRLEPEDVPLPDSLRPERTPRGVRIALPGLFGARLEADDDGVRVTRPLGRPRSVLADDLLALDAEEVTERPGERPRYRLVARLRRRREVLVDRIATAVLAQALRQALARVLGLERD